MEKKRLVTRSVDADHSRLYGSLDDAILYLQEIKEKHPDAMLEENWWGYEDMTMRFAWAELETDEEFEKRLAAQRIKAKLDAEAKKREEQRKADLKELNRLKTKLGVRY